MEVTVARTRGRDGLTIGLHEAERYDSVLDVERCLLQSDRMNAQLDETRRFFAQSGLSAGDQDSNEGLLRFLMLREGYRTGETMVNVVASSPAVSELAPLAERLGALGPRTTSGGLNGSPQEASGAVGVAGHLLGGRRPT